MVYDLAIIDIVISLTKIRDCDWSYTHHAIWTNDHCWPVQQHPREHDSCSPRTWPVSQPRYSQLIFGPNAILGTSIIYYALWLLTS